MPMLARKTDGFALIDLIFVVGMIALLCMIGMPRLLMAQQTAGSASAIGSMRTIGSSQLIFALTCGGGFYAPKLTTLGTAPPGTREAFIGESLGQADQVTRSMYIVRMSATPHATAPASCNGLPMGQAGQAFKAGADPAQPGNTRFFATNANSQVWEHDATLYPVMPEVGEPPIGHPLEYR
jgi:type II secretory pathway pseudopilin PulG